MHTHQAWTLGMWARGAGWSRPSWPWAPRACPPGPAAAVTCDDTHNIYIYIYINLGFHGQLKINRGVTATLQELRLGYHSRAGLEPGTSGSSTLLRHSGSLCMCVCARARPCVRVCVQIYTRYTYSNPLLGPVSAGTSCGRDLPYTVVSCSIPCPVSHVRIPVSCVGAAGSPGLAAAAETITVHHDCTISITSLCHVIIIALYRCMPSYNTAHYIISKRSRSA
jgi:hypothetical protein